MQNQQQFTPEQGQQSIAQLKQVIQDQGMRAELLVELGQAAQQAIETRDIPAFLDWLRSKGISEEKLGGDVDIQELVGMVALGQAAQQIMQEREAEAESAQSNPQPAQPVSPEQLQSIAAQGVNGDTMLAHVNPQEMAMLQQMGGAGTINPETGLPEFSWLSDLWDDVWGAVKKVAKAIAPVALPAIAIFAPALIPAVGTYLGASAALAPVVGAAVISGGITALSGGTVKDVLSSAALTGLGAYLTPIVGNYVGNAAGVTSQTLKTVIGSGIVAGGFTAARGGSVGQILTAAATGAAGAYLGQIATDAWNGGAITNKALTQGAFDDAAFAAADAKQLADMGLSQSQITSTLKASGLDSTSASNAAAAATQGKSAAEIAAKISNGAGSKATLYTGGTAPQQSIVGGSNTAILERVQGIEDAQFVAQDVANMKAAGLKPAQIEQNLIAAGVDPTVAKYASVQSVSSQQQIASNLINKYTSGTTSTQLFAGDPTTAPRAVGGDFLPETRQTLTDAEFIAADAAQLKAQGLSTAQIKDTLVRSGVDANTASYAASNANSASLTANLVARAANASTPLMAADASAATRTLGSGLPADIQNRIADAEFIAADAQQLKAQGLSTAQIKSTLIASGVDSATAAYAASYSGYSDLATRISNNTSLKTMFSDVTASPTYVSPKEQALIDQGATKLADGTYRTVQNGKFSNYDANGNLTSTREFVGGQAVETYYDANGKVTSTASIAQGQATAAPIRDNPNATITTPVSNQPTTPTTPVSDTGGTQIGGGPAAPYDIRSTGYSDSAPGTIFDGPNGPEIVLNSGKTVLATDYYNAVNSGTPVSVDGMMPASGSIRIEITGVPYLADSYNLPSDLQIPEGYRLATLAEANAGKAGETAVTLPDGRMAWITPVEAPTVIPGTAEGGGGGAGQVVYSDGSTQTTLNDGTVIIDWADGTTEVRYTDGTVDTVGGAGQISVPVITNPDGTQTQYYNNGGSQVVYADGSTATTLPDGTTIIDYADGSTQVVYPDGTSDTVGGTPVGPTTPSTGGDTTGGTGGTGGAGTGTGTGTQAPGSALDTSGGAATQPQQFINADGSTTTIYPDGTVLVDYPNGTTTMTGPGGTTDTVTTPVTPTTPVDTTPPDNTGTPSGIDTTTPYIPTPIPPTTPTSPVTGDGGSYRLNWGDVQMPVTRTGLNPGWIQPVPQYQTTSPVQSQFFWGMHPYQSGGPTGQVFDPNLAKASPLAPAQPWGIQQIFTPQTSGNVMQQLLQGQNPYASVLNLGK